MSGTAGPVTFAVQGAAKASNGFNAVVDPANFLFNDDKDGYKNQSVSANLGFTAAPGQEFTAQFFRSHLEQPVRRRRRLRRPDDHRRADVAGRGPQRARAVLGVETVGGRRDRRQQDRVRVRRFSVQDDAAAVRVAERVHAAARHADRGFRAARGASRDHRRLRHDRARHELAVRHLPGAHRRPRAAGESAPRRLQPVRRQDDGLDRLRLSLRPFAARHGRLLHRLQGAVVQRPLLPRASPIRTSCRKRRRTSKRASTGTATSQRRASSCARSSIATACRSSSSFSATPTSTARRRTSNRATLEGVTLGLEARADNGATLSASLDIQSPEDDVTGKLLPRRARRHGAVTVGLSGGTGAARRRARSPRRCATTTRRISCRMGGYAHRQSDGRMGARERGHAVRARRQRARQELRARRGTSAPAARRCSPASAPCCDELASHMPRPPLPVALRLRRRPRIRRRRDETRGPPMGLVAAVLASGLPAARAAVEAQDDAGATVKLAAPATRIVSLAPHATELLYAAGAGDRVVGVLATSDWPPEALREAEGRRFARARPRAHPRSSRRTSSSRGRSRRPRRSAR